MRSTTQSVDYAFDADPDSTDTTTNAMVFWMAGEVDAAAYDVFSPVSRWADDAVNALLQVSDYGADINKWAFIAMIFATVCGTESAANG